MDDEMTGIEAQNDPDFHAESLTVEELEERDRYYNPE